MPNSDQPLDAAQPPYTFEPTTDSGKLREKFGELAEGTETGRFEVPAGGLTEFVERHTLHLRHFPRHIDHER